MDAILQLKKELPMGFIEKRQIALGKKAVVVIFATSKKQKHGTAFKFN